MINLRPEVVPGDIENGKRSPSGRGGGQNYETKS